MAQIKLAQKIWDSVNYIACTCTAGTPVYSFDCNDCCTTMAPRPASLVPQVDCGVTKWIFYDNLTAWPSVTGARNGIATEDVNGVITLWDINGAGSTISAAGDTPGEKMDVFAACSTFATEMPAYYDCTYPTVTTTTYCYTVTITSQTGSPNERTALAIQVQDYSTGYPEIISYNRATDVAVYRVCLDRPIAQVGNPATQTWVLI